MAIQWAMIMLDKDAELERLSWKANQLWKAYRYAGSKAGRQDAYQQLVMLLEDCRSLVFAALQQQSVEEEHEVSLNRAPAPGFILMADD